MQRKLFLIIFTSVLLSNIKAHAQFNFQQYGTPPGVNANSCRMSDISIDPLNNKWVSFGTNGVGVFDNTAWLFYNTGNSPLPSDSATCSTFDQGGNAWIGTANGLAFKNGPNWTIYNTGNSGLTNNTITTITVTNTTVWIGTLDGLARFDGNNWTHYNTSNSGLPNDSITRIESDNVGNLWVGTRNGLAFFDGTTWVTYTSLNSVLGPHIYDLKFDAFNRLWISCGVTSGIQSITTGIYFFDNGLLKNFLTDLYSKDLNIQYPNQITFARTNIGEIIFRVTSGSNNYLIKCLQSGIVWYEMPPLNLSSLLLGFNLVIDQSNILWWIPRFRFYFYSIDINSYVPQLNSQLNPDNFRKLDINEVSAAILVDGDMHWDRNYASYEVPKNSGLKSVFSSALWIGGIDAGGQLHTAVQTYRQTGTDYWPGPISGLSMPMDSATCLQFNRIWKIDKWKLTEFIDNFNSGNVANGTYAVSEEFATWPAKGNGSVTDQLAPFVDLNGDGLYNVYDGDYPLIKGDQMLYWIFNDSLSVHNSTVPAGIALGVEVHAAAYAYFCQGIADSNRVLNTTTFYDYTIINRSNHDYDSLYVGLWSDVSLGNDFDDYIGCDSLLSAGFVYNGDNDDETVDGYGLNPPMQNIKVLKGMIADPGDGVDNNLNGITDEPGERTTMNHFMPVLKAPSSPVGSPVNAGDYYNFMRSIWKDGMPLHYGADGRDVTAPLTNFMFSGLPYDTTGWTELSAGNVPEDRRLLVSSGPISFDAGDTASITFAFIFTHDSNAANGLTTSIARNRADLERIQHWFDIDSFPSCEVYTVGYNEQVMNKQFAVYPNPGTNHIFISGNNPSCSKADVTVLTTLGEEIYKGVWGTDPIDMSRFSSGLYFIYITTPTGVEVHKWICSQ